MEDKKDIKKMKRMKMIDFAVTVVFVVALVVIYFFWKCEWDLFVTIIAAVIIAIAGIITYNQYKKIEKLETDAEENKE